MKPENAIEVKDVRKKFKVYYDKGSQLKERILFRKRNRYEERWVLNGISFDVKKGEAIGLIGHNGCGKSTTLKLLTRIMYPDSGSINMRGRVSSLIELGAGFHPDMSGRENIYTNASIFGLTKKEIDERLDDIIAFSEMEPYLDNPVRTYSSGMYMRLAFSVAINVNADILLIDEILAVGDINFQAKCFNKLREIKAEGKPRDIHPQYMDFMGQQRQEISGKETARQEEKSGKKAGERTEEKDGADKKRWGNGYARIRQINMLDALGKRQKTFVTGSKVVIEMDYTVSRTVKNAVFGIGIFTRDGKQCYGTNTRIDQLQEFDLEKDGVMRITLDKVNLLPGVYLLDVAIESDVGNPVDYFREAYTFEMYSAIGDVGMVRLDHTWEI